MLALVVALSIAVGFLVVLIQQGSCRLVGSSDGVLVGSSDGVRVTV